MLLCTGSTVAQSLTGQWEGEVPHTNKKLTYTAAVTIEQNGKKLSGTARYTQPITNSFVVERFKGSLKANGKVELEEYEVVDHYMVNEDAWCVKLLEGQLTVNEATNTMTITGTWRSLKVYDGIQYSVLGSCPPGTFTLSKAIEPPKTATLAGTIYDKKTRKPIAAQVKVQTTHGTPEPTATKGPGKYALMLAPKQTVLVTVEAENYRSVTDQFALKSGYTIKNYYLYPMAKPVALPISDNTYPVNEAFTMPNVLFVTSTTQLVDGATAALNQLVTYLQHNPTLHLQVDGHTDREGNSKKNKVLSEQRAKTIKGFLVKQGIARRRIATQGHGDAQIICPPPCSDNRRVEFTIVTQ